MSSSPHVVLVLNIVSTCTSCLLCTAPISVFFPAFRHYLEQVRERILDDRRHGNERRPTPVNEHHVKSCETVPTVVVERRISCPRVESPRDAPCIGGLPVNLSFTLEVPPLSFTANVFCCLVWCWFSWCALGSDGWALRFCNTYGTPVCLLLLWLYFRFYKVSLYEKELKWQVKAGILLVAALIVAFATCLLCDRWVSKPRPEKDDALGGGTGPSETVFYEVLAWFGTLSGILMYGHPLFQMLRVLKSNNVAKFGSVSMNAVAFLNCSVWTVNGVILELWQLFYKNWKKNQLLW